MDPRDDDIQFDFFEDEPATSETAQPRVRLPRRGNSGGRLFLMDATDSPRSWLLENVTFELPASNYRVTAAYYKQDDVSFVAHEWRAQRRIA